MSNEQSSKTVVLFNNKEVLRKTEQRWDETEACCDLWMRKNRMEFKALPELEYVCERLNTSCLRHAHHKIASMTTWACSILSAT